mgnify:FL=1
MKNIKKKIYKFIDLFAGLGGFHLALEQYAQECNCECTCVFASELKEDLRKLYAENYPGTRIEGDITQIKPEEIPSHDILCAGFPCQPFSQAGKQQGFNDEKNRGNLFDYICAIVKYHRPKYILLENVSNLKGHDHGNTWAVINQRLLDLDYDVPEPAILSPHQFGKPQHRKRIYIVAVDRNQGGIGNFRFPEATNKKCDIKKIINDKDPNYMHLKPETRRQLEVWQKFIDETIAHGHEIPRFPIWAMEFGADYPIDIAPAFNTPDKLIGQRGKLGRVITEGNLSDCLVQLPNYAQTNKTRVFPKWKIRYISENRRFYKENKEWLDEWLKEVMRFENSHLKLEWNCGKCRSYKIEDKIVQFRASGIRIKKPDYSPALNLVGTQIPILPWIKLPADTLKDGEPSKGRYMTVTEAAKLQGMGSLSFGSLSQGRCFEALGNAINVEVVKEIVKNLLNNGK